ncbi:MAG: polyphosphate polymerase domain-containing protein [Spirochaetales bacterium]|jgi:SPX domain protein involved in polyphosphate accumulation|nr:polyphosphate polymerase domain-containing protein [Spirochaetales bacterium]
MAIEVFNRFEKKYVLNHDDAGQLEEELLSYMAPDKHNADHRAYTISNIYYDTEDNDLIRASLSKPVYKEKLRMRAYGVPDAQGKVYLEIKKKFRGRVNKRRTILGLQEAYDFVATGRQPNRREYMNHQVVAEIEFFLRCYDVHPTLYLAYDRQAYFSTEDPDLRITFDSRIRTRRYDLGLELGDHGEGLLDDGAVVMEVKTAGNFPLWLSGLLADHRIYRTSFSKYGREYETMLANNIETSKELLHA